MFQKAYEIASQYTAPVVLSRKTISGECNSSIGAYVFLNDKGWIVTAFHILKQYEELANGEKQARDIEVQVQAIENDQSLDRRARKKKISKIRKMKKSDTSRGSAWFGRDKFRIVEWAGLEAVDIAVARLEPFDPAWVSKYPTFKDPTKDFDPGASLCKLGYPFHQINPTWNDTKDAFELPAGSVPLPLFPIDGILTRIAELVATNAPPPPFPMRWIETSTPGLRGQSGGPVFDIKGTIWGIQVNTAHYPLGFDPAVPGAPASQREHQFLNVGRGVHPDTLFGLFDQLGLSYDTSTY